MRLLILLMFLAFPASAITPDEVHEQYPLVQQANCTDNQTEEQGLCFVFDTGKGIYLVFVQNGAPVFMRHVLHGATNYTEVWRAPIGTSL